jgi:hypothetical protein
VTRPARSYEAEAKFRTRVAELGGEVLYTEWLGVMKPHRVRCAAGHECAPWPCGVIQGQGLCSICAGTNSRAAEIRFRASVEKQGGTVLEGEWLGKDKPHRVLCEVGHECTPTPASVRDGGGICRTCAGRDPRASEAAFRRTVEQAGGVVIEPLWLGIHAPHRVRCAVGHESAPHPSKVRDGAGICRVCRGFVWDAFYLVANEADQRLKFGITSGDPEQRISVQRRIGYAKTIRAISGLRGSLAPDLERKLINELPGLGHPPVAGREFYALSALPVTLEIIDNTLAIRQGATMTATPESLLVEDDDFDPIPDHELVLRVAGRVKAHLGHRRTGKVMFDDIVAAILADPQLAAEFARLDDGARELLLDDVQTEIG